MTPTLPLAPLTLNEINARVREAKTSVAYYTATVFREGRLEGWELAAIRDRCATLDLHCDAARARLRPLAAEAN